MENLDAASQNTPLILKSVHLKLLKEPNRFFTILGHKGGFSDGSKVFDFFFYALDDFFIIKNLRPEHCIGYVPEIKLSLRPEEEMTYVTQPLRKHNQKDFYIAFRRTQSGSESDFNFGYWDGNQLRRIQEYSVATKQGLTKGLPRRESREYRKSIEEMKRDMEKRYVQAARTTLI